MNEMHFPNRLHYLEYHFIDHTKGISYHANTEGWTKLLRYNHDFHSTTSIV